MAVDERARHALYERLMEVLGVDDADTAMALLPPVGWADVATKHDLDQFRVALALQFDLVRAEIRESQQASVNAVTWRVFGMQIGLLAVVIALLVPLFT